MEIDLYSLIFFQLNSHEFRSVLPSVARRIDNDNNKSNESKWLRYRRENPRFVLYLAAILLGLIALIFAGIFMLVSLFFFVLTSFFLFIIRSFAIVLNIRIAQK